jgi:hypothetical protein
MVNVNDNKTTEKTPRFPERLPICVKWTIKKFNKFKKNL